MAIIITSEQTIPIDEPFKVSAGPGAGKTHWLISHIKNVVSNSNKLDVVKRWLVLPIPTWVPIPLHHVWI